MSPVSASSASAAFTTPAVGKAPDPQAQKAQANAQADLLLALKGTQQASVAMAHVVRPGGVDLYA
ncbi:hypothetical protein [Pilimelia columellifera]|uniref:Uncharacterized protein n=1 Tax=Pilimelia columellifera subsp. columellifera TaxID=706583 RepID=A0ABN3MZ63_9ACTN